MSVNELFENGYGNSVLSAMLTGVSKIKGIDVELALSRISGKQNILEACIEQTVSSVGEKLKTMSICLSSGDLYGFSIEAHGLKVAFAGIGATEHSALAFELEKLAKSGGESECKRLFIKFAGFAKSLTADLKSAIPDNNTAAKIKGENADLFRVVQSAADCLNSFETDEALNQLKILETLTFGEETDELLRHIKNTIKAYKYEEAVFLLRSIIDNPITSEQILSMEDV